MSDKFKWLPMDGKDEKYVNDRTGVIVGEVYEEMSGDWGAVVRDVVSGSFVSKQKAKRHVERECAR